MSILKKLFGHKKWHSQFDDIKARRPLGKNVLIIEDDRRLARSLKRAFIKAGYDATYALDVQSARQENEMSCKDLFVVDLALPGISGLDFISDLRNEEKTSKIPIMVYSGFTQISDSKLSDLKVEKVVQKPCKLIKLINHADELVGIGTTYS